MPRSSTTVAYLDGIRGVAAFLVFVHHFLLAFYCSFYTFDINASHIGGWEIAFGRSVFSVLTNGNFWVHVFFVLSGFVLSRGYFHTNNIETVVSAFHRRFLRLYIPVAFTMILSYMMIKGGLFFNSPAALVTHSEWWLGAMWNPTVPFEKLLSCLAYETMFQGDNSFDTCMWTISPELYGLLFVFAFLVFTHFTRYRLFLLSLAFMYFYTFHNTIYVSFVLGMSLCHTEKMVENRKNKGVTVVATVILLVAIILGSYPSYGGRAGTLFEHLGHTLLEYTDWYHTLGAYLFVLPFVLSPIFQQALSLLPFRFLGRISFSLYLLHALAIGSFSSWLFIHLYTHTGYHLAVAIVFIATTAVVLLASWLMTRYIDEYCVSFTKLVYQHLLAKRPELQKE